MKYIDKILDPVCFSGIMIMLIILSCLIIYLWRNRGYLAYMLIIFFGLCCVLIFLNYFAKILPLRPDTVEDYIPAGQYISKMIGSGLFSFIDPYNIKRLLEDQFLGYTLWLGIIFSITDNSFIAGNFVATIFGLLTIVQLYHLTKDLYDIPTARFTIMLFILSPFLVFISSITMRDIPVAFFIVWYYRLWLLYEKYPTQKYLLLMIFSLLYMGTLRPAIMLVVVATSIIYKVLFDVNVRRTKMFKFLMVFFGLLSVVVFIWFLINYKQIVDIRLLSGLKYIDIDKINIRVAFSSTAGSAYYPELKYGSVYDILTSIPLLTVYFLCAPFPWQVEKTNQLLALADSAVLWFLYIFFFLEARSFYRRNKKWAIIIFMYLFLGIGSSSMLQANASAAQRHRIMFTILILPIAAHQILVRWRGKRAGALKNRSGYHWAAPGKI